METKLPTLEEALEIVEQNDAFYFKEEVFQDRKFLIFNYRLASYTDFTIPGAIELRGLTFDKTTGMRWLGLHKFFNNNENPFSSDATPYEFNGTTHTTRDWNTTVLDVREKLDGSLIQPIVIDEKIYLKTKGTFYSEQAKLAQELLERQPNLEFTLVNLINMGFFPLLEYTSPENQIVVDYEDESLKILQLRKMNGEYITYDKMKTIIPPQFLVNSVPYSLRELVEKQATEVGIEGWVAFNNSEETIASAFRKFKTADYFTKHRLISPDEIVPHKIIQHILDETIDDIICVLKDGIRKQKIEKIITLVDKFFNHEFKELGELYKLKNTMTAKDFALKYRNVFGFGCIMKAKDTCQLEKCFKEYIIKLTNKESKAKEFIKDLEEKENS